MRLVLSGYYGFGNLGDEAVLAGLLSAFEQRGAATRSAFTVLSAAPRDTADRHGVRAVPRMKLLPVRAALRGADLLVSGGGSLLQDATSVRSLFYYLWVMRLAVSMGRPFVICAQGIGPLHRPLSKTLTRLTLSRASAIAVRDADSAELLLRIGVRLPRAVVTADPAFALPAADPARGRAILAECGAPSDRVICMAVREWQSSERLAETFAETARSLAEETGSSVVLLPMHYPDDVVLADAIGRLSGGLAHVTRRQLGVDEARALVAACDALVAMRLHALIFAAAAAVPMVSVSYDPKVASFMQQIGQGDMNVPHDGLSSSQVVERVRVALSEAGARGRSLASARVRLAESALQNVDVAMGALSGRA